MRDALTAVAELLEKGDARYAVIGAHAVNAWLEPRFTADVDVTLDATIAELTKIEDVFRTDGFRIDAEHGAAQPSGPDFVRLISADGTVVVELQLAKTELQRLVVARAKATPSGARVATAEDLLVLKLIANRSKDRIDLEGLLGLPDLDWGYVEARSREWDVLDLLGQLRAGRP